MLGGAGVYAFHLTKELVRRGHEVHVISPNIEKKETDTVEDGVFVHRIPVINEPLLYIPSFWFSLSKKNNKLCKSEHGFDIHHDNGVIGDVGILRPRLNGQRVVTIHHLQSTFTKHQPLLKGLLSLNLEGAFPSLILARNVVHRADKIIVVSNFTKNDLMQTYKIPSSRIEVVYNGVFPDDFVFRKKEIQNIKGILHLKDEIVFLFVGRINDPRKDLFLLLKAWALLAKKHKSVKLLVVGSGDQTIARTLAKSMCIGENIFFTGHVGNEVLNKIYCACDIFVSPSLLEGFGLTLVEAMAAGKPVIACNSGATREIVTDGINGKVLNNRDPKSLAEAMEFFVLNPECINKIGRSNREYVSKKFDWKTTATLTERTYENLLGDPESSARTVACQKQPK
jgi:glycosyltransferase involved in cell wall biosynthesis